MPAGSDWWGHCEEGSWTKSLHMSSSDSEGEGPDQREPASREDVGWVVDDYDHSKAFFH